MDSKKIEEIINLMKESELTEFEIHEENFSLRIKRGGDAPIAIPAVQAAPQIPAPAPAASSSPEATSAATSPAEDPSLETITSPIVGTFYHAASPDAPPFVKSGDTVEKSSVVCIIEAMKVMNEIQAETQGTIVEVLAQNGQAIEFGQPLFKIKSA